MNEEEVFTAEPLTVYLYKINRFYRRSRLMFGPSVHSKCIVGTNLGAIQSQDPLRPIRRHLTVLLIHH